MSTVAKAPQSLESLPALHPTRVRETLRSLSVKLAEAKESPSAFECGVITEMQTCLAALKLIGKTQEATGLTTDVVDVGQAAMKLLGTLSRLRK